ncbi:glycosyltransferase family 4 protein [Dyadobacter sp.]|uniref:glycosyltransferase family 4 protein n=1 Tax=Dyadobacter sp. TaxID=1914288 RepID=UPI003F6EC1B1
MSSRKRLTYVLHSIAIGGVEVALLSAVPALHKQYELTIIVLGKINAEIMSHLSEEEKQVFVPLDYPVPLYPIVLPKIVRTILQTRPDILVCSLWRSSLVGTLCKMADKNIKLYSFIHSTDFPHAFAKQFNKYAVRKADFVLVDSAATKKYVADHFKPKAEIKVVSFLTRSTPSVNKAIAPQTQDNVRFMFLGRINKVKNLPDAIELIKYLHQNNVKAHFDIYGRDDDGTATGLQQIISESDLNTYIQLKGEVTGSQKWEIFPNYHFYLQLSFNEGMAMSVTEAMQNGVVSVVSPVGEIVNYSTDMDSAVFIDVHNPAKKNADFAKVLNVIQNPALYSKLSSNCHANFASKKLYADSLIEQIETTYS